MAVCAAIPAAIANAFHCTINCRTPTAPKFQTVDETQLAFAKQPGEVAIPVKAGDLGSADGRVLHARPNHSDQRRPVILALWRFFPFPSVPVVGRRHTSIYQHRPQRDLRKNAANQEVFKNNPSKARHRDELLQSWLTQFIDHLETVPGGSVGIRL